MTEWRTLRWHCPHCPGTNFRLPAAQMHLNEKHNDCYSCHLERLLMKAIMEGRGHFVEGKMPF